MYISTLIILIIILFETNSEYEKISLKLDSDEYYIPIKLGENRNIEYFIFSNIPQISFFPSSKCSICETFHINENDNNSYSFIKDNIVVPYYYYNFTGDLYNTNITLGSQIAKKEFLAFDKILYIDNYNGKGRFSLSFLNYNFNTSNKIFALTLNHNGGQLDLGDYNHDIIKDKSKLHTFNITTTNINNTNEYLNSWYINFTKLTINNRNVDYNNNIKFTFDISTNYFFIPKDFFFNNAHRIFSEKSKCQVQIDGYFVCMCDQNYGEKFGNFKFFNENNEYIEVKYSDYISLDETTGNNICYILIKINYETDLFIAGKYVMNNYYTIFDVDNNQLKTYPLSQEYLFYDQRNVIIFLFVICIGGLIFLSCFCIYRNFFSGNNDVVNLNKDLIEENNGEGNDQENEENNNQEGENDNIIEMNNENSNYNINGNNSDNEININNEDEIDKIELKDDIENNDNEYINNNQLI